VGTADDVRQRWFERLEVLLLAGAGLAWCVSRCAWHVLDPRETAWMHNGDWEVYYQAWLLHTRLCFFGTKCSVTLTSRGR